MTDDEVEYCAECGEPEFDEDGYETHLDEDEYDHDFEYEEEVSPLEDIKEIADTVKSLAEAGKAVKELTQPSKIDPSELTVNRFKVPPPIDKVPDLEINEHPDVKTEKRHKQMMKLGIIGIIVATLLGIAALIL